LYLLSNDYRMKHKRYNQLKVYPTLFLIFLLSVVQCLGQSAQSEESNVKDAVNNYYIKGLKIRNFDLIKHICIDEAKLYGVRQDGSLGITTLEKWSRRFDPENPPFKSLESEITKVDVVGNAAQVKIWFLMDGREIHDLLNLLKIEDRWRIVNMIDYADPND